ncbi:hypothetical protein BC941DRAFT_514953 [Chlamydoabsidia padenii]|nr:hypothetical protein BC941DRAFT_514953 [Chlamydoabsidia padenii]
MESIKVLYFAGVADITQVESEQVMLADNSMLTVDGVLKYLAHKYGPRLTVLLDTCHFALDMEYVSRTESIQPGQEMAIIPPVSGG